MTPPPAAAPDARAPDHTTKHRAMSETKTNAYEALVLFPQSAASDLQGCADHVREILDRGGVELLALKKWDERRLAYDISGNKRGLYFLAYFRGPGTALAKIERAMNLSERILRNLVLRVDEMTDDEMRAADGREQLQDEIRLRQEGEVAAVAEPEAAVDADLDPIADDLDSDD